MKPKQLLLLMVTFLLASALLLSACGNSAPQINEVPPNEPPQTDETDQDTADEGSLDQPEESADFEGEIEVEDEIQLVELRQWAASATASHEYSADIKGAIQATGKPDTKTCGDLLTAWSPWEEDTVETLELSYQTPVFASQVNVYQTYSPDQVVLIELLDESGTYQIVYEAEPAAIGEDECPYILEVQIAPATETLVTGVRITIDQSNPHLSWNQIDAVELVGGFYSTEDPETASADPEERDLLDLEDIKPDYVLPDEIIGKDNASQVTELWYSGNGNWIDGAWSDNGLYAGVATSLGAYVFDSVSGDLLIFKKHTSIRSIAFSHDEQSLAVATWNKITLFALLDGAELVVIEPEFQIDAVAFHLETGNLVVKGESASQPGEVIFQHYDPQSGSLVMEEKAATSLFGSIVINKLAADGRHLLKTQLASDVAEIFDTSGAVAFKGNISGIGPTAEIYDVLAGDYIVTNSAPDEYQVYSVDGSLVGTLPKPENWELGVGIIWSHGESALLYEGISFQLYEYSLPDLDLVETSTICGNNIRSLSPDLTRSISQVGWEINDTINFCNLVAKLEIDLTQTDVTLNPVKPQLVKLGGTYDLDYYGQSIFTVWDLTTGVVEKIVTFTEDFDPLHIRSMQFLQDGKTLMLSAFAPVNEMIFFDLDKEEIVDRLPMESSVLMYAVSPDMKTLAASYLDPVMVELWDLNTKSLLGMQLITGQYPSVTNLAFSPDSKSVYVGGSITFRWELEALENPIEYGIDPALVFSPDLKIAAGLVNDALIVTDLETLEPMGPYPEWLAPGEQYYGAMVFSNDGKLLIASTSEGVILVDVSTGEVVQRLDHQNVFFSVLVSSDGTLISTYSQQDAVIRLWGIP